MSQTGFDYAPKGKPQPVCRPGEFKFAAVALAHGHIYGQCNGLVEAGAELRWVFDPDPAKVESFRKTFPQVQAAQSLEQILDDPEI
jgi:predicted dehydrogenase